MEFLRGIADSSTDGNKVRISPGLFQPIAADDVRQAKAAEAASLADRPAILRREWAMERIAEALDVVRVTPR
jgi:hypothetical protein